MKILFCAKFFLPGFGGGEAAVHSFLKYAISCGYECTALCFRNGLTIQPFKESNTLKVDGIKIIQSCESETNAEYIKKFLEEEKPDVVFTQSTNSLLYLQIAKELNIKTILAIHFYNEIISTSQPYFIDVLSNNPSIQIEKERQEVFKLADEFFVNSEFMADVIKKYVGIKCKHVIYPPINLDKIIATDKNPQNITYINLCIGKGFKVAVQLAAMLPQYRFQIVGALYDRTLPNLTVYNQANALKNVFFTGHIDNMSEVYKSTKILLMPSLVAETYSMTTVEAFWNGIPVIGGTQGNLPYLIDNNCGKIIDTNNLKAWKDEIENLMNNNRYYGKKCRYVCEYTQKFHPEEQCQKFIKLVDNLIENNRDTRGKIPLPGMLRSGV